ncbi:DUF2071 domain-containing protein [Georgenia sp. MJ206]|uniref:YqjF family protein n=1 Tax=Georgenia wangjunii TaxID=3117730 RepID=UPI002F2627D5
MPAQDPPHRVGLAANVQGWEDITFLHWSFPVTTVQALLPPGLRVHDLDGRAWVGVTPFRMRDVRLPRVPPLPHLSTFPEVNVRTYVRGRDGTAGIWFFSLDCPRLPVIGALRVLGLPYMWAAMALQTDRERGRVAYASSRRAGPGPRGAGVRALVEAGPRIADPDDLVVELTARWWAFSRRAGRVWRVPAEHPPWPLHEATARVDAGGLLVAAGLPLPGEPPMVHFSPGVETRLGLPRPA